MPRSGVGTGKKQRRWCDDHYGGKAQAAAQAAGVERDRSRVCQHPLCQQQVGINLRPNGGRARPRKYCLRHSPRKAGSGPYAAKRRQEWISWLEKEKSGPCKDCGGRFHPQAMHFDHRPGETKLFSLSGSAMRPWADIVAERAKCDLVCANCHAVRTYNRRQAGLS